MAPSLSVASVLLVLFFAGHAGATLETETCIPIGSGDACEVTGSSLLQAQRGRTKHSTVEEKPAESGVNINASASREYLLREDNGGYMKRPESWDTLFQGSHVDDNVTHLPKNLYMFWDQGDVENTTPPLNKMCFEKWPALNPTWNYHLVTSNASAKAPEVGLTSLAPQLTDLFQSNPRTVQLRSDMLRLEIMAEHGGVWADGSLLPLRGLDTFAKHLVAQSGFFVFTYPNTEDPFFHYNASKDPANTWISSWFMVSKPQNPLVVAWRDAFKKNWMDPGHDFAYFEVHETFKAMILEKDPRIIEVWRSMPRISSHWPQLCLPGCADYWQTSNLHDRPPFLKRPYQDGNLPDGRFPDGSLSPPSKWLEQWRDLLPQTAQTAQ